MALEHYLQQTLLLPWEDMTDLCEFLSSNVVKQRPDHHKRRHVSAENKVLMSDTLAKRQ